MSIAKKQSVKKIDMNARLKKGMGQFAEASAKQFIEYINLKLRPEYEVELLGIKITAGELYDTLQRKGKIVSVKSGKTKEYTYQDIWNYFEYGRLDLGVTPDPVLSKLFKEFKPIYEESLKHELTKHRKKAR